MNGDRIEDKNKRRFRWFFLSFFSLFFNSQDGSKFVLKIGHLICRIFSILIDIQMSWVIIEGVHDLMSCGGSMLPTVER